MAKPKFSIAAYLKWVAGACLLLGIWELMPWKLPAGINWVLNLLLLVLILPALIEFYAMRAGRTKRAANEGLLRVSVGILRVLDLIPHNPYAMLLPYQLSRLAGIVQAKGKPEQAEQLYRDSVVAMAKVSGPGSVEQGLAMIDLTSCLVRQFKLKDAQAVGTQALEVMKRHKDSAPVEAALALSVVAGVETRLGKFEAAIKHGTDALSLVESVPASGQEFTGLYHMCSILNELGAAHAAANQPRQAYAYFKRDLALAEKFFGADSSNVALSCSNLCSAASCLKNYTEADQYGTRALDLLTKVGNPNDPLLASAMNNLADNYRRSGRFPMAEKLLQQILELRQNSPNQPELAYSLMSMAKLKQATGDFEAAERFCKNSLVIRQKSLPQDHPDIAEAVRAYERIVTRSNIIDEPTQQVEGDNIAEKPGVFA